MARILIYGTDEVVTHKISQAMQKEGYRVGCCDTSSKLPSSLENPALVIIDARLKWSVCRPLFNQIQKIGCPVLFLTADREMNTHLRALYRGDRPLLSPEQQAAQAEAAIRMCLCFPFHQRRPSPRCAR